ncbi:MAG: hypothetical protein OEY41_05600 [Acidimicrobiia bacterium]|nr:hypothetical protein [Acidimicrobiia bacterium]MDH4362484.1 hypothetical protein [Acidimicrobiia bacterium]MDH5289454.1 hypothetical protein [Acidimicrobiia bacterium]
MARFLITSLVLTITLNVVIRLIPGLPDRLGRWMASLLAPPPAGPGEPAGPDDRSGRSAPRVRVYVPWKAMIVGSIVLSVGLNLVALLLR